MPNRPYDTAGLDNPDRRWLGQLVRVKSRPEWGILRVVRWFPQAGEGSERLRLMPFNGGSQKVVDATDVDVVDLNGDGDPPSLT